MTAALRQIFHRGVVAGALLGIFLLPFQVLAETPDASHEMHEMGALDCDENGCVDAVADVTCLEHCLSVVDAGATVAMPASPRVTVAFILRERITAPAFATPASVRVASQVRIRDAIPILSVQKRE